MLFFLQIVAFEIQGFLFAAALRLKITMFIFHPKKKKVIKGGMIEERSEGEEKSTYLNYYQYAPKMSASLILIVPN